MRQTSKKKGRLGPCPICGKTCIVAADGRNGFCRDLNKPWETRLVKERYP